MNAKILLTLIALVGASTPAFATDASQSPLTRAQVRAELARAYETGEVGRLNKVSYPDRSLASIASVRAQQRAALRRERLQQATSRNEAGSIRPDL